MKDDSPFHTNVTSLIYFSVMEKNRAYASQHRCSEDCSEKLSFTENEGSDLFKKHKHYPA